MTYKEIKSCSKNLIKHKISKSVSILVLYATLIAFFTVLSYAIIKAIDFFGLKIIADQYSIYIYPAVIAFILLAVALWACCAYSSVSLGEKAWFTGNLNKKKDCVRRLFFWLQPKSSFKALKFNFILLCVKLFWLTVFLILPTLIFTTVIILAQSGGIEVYLLVSLTAGGIVMTLTGLIFYFLVIQRYFIAPYLIASNPKLGAIQAIRQSKNILEGHIFKIVRFKLGFIPWFLLFPLIIPMIYTYPYYKQSCSVIAKEICL